MMRSNLRWCPDGLEFTCWNGDVIRAALLIDADDREIIAWRAVANAGTSGSDVRGMLLDVVEKRFGAFRAPQVIEVLSDYGSSHSKGNPHLARQLRHCFMPVASPQSNGMSEAFLRTLKRDYIRVKSLPDA
jgi:transposase InsO family protein